MDVADKLKRMKVSDIMIQDMPTVRESEPLSRVAQLLKKKYIFSIPVVDARGHFVGEVDERDFIKLFVDPKRMKLQGLFGVDVQYFAENVKGLMRRHRRSLSPDQSVEEAASVMLNNGVTTMPVVDKGRIKGFITVERIIEKIEEEFE
ncbi:MAG: CBS domain-containing protein [Candidatus Diapherotrites archaeon]|nr:CBS domain-containing protein [Candidatus Diapherotrites archaeon]